MDREQVEKSSLALCWLVCITITTGRLLGMRLNPELLEGSLMDVHFRPGQVHHFSGEHTCAISLRHAVLVVVILARNKPDEGGVLFVRLDTNNKTC